MSARTRAQRWGAFGSTVGFVTMVVIAASAPPAMAQTVVTTEAELRTAFGDATEDHILLGADINLADCVEGDVERVSAVDVLLDGDGHTITQTCAGERVLNASGGGALSLLDVTLTGGDAAGGSGGAVLSTGAVTITGATLTGNFAGFAGAVFTNGTITIVDSELTLNKSNANGGALAADGAISVSGSLLGFNTSGSFGGVMLSGDITVTDSQFVDNVAESGGAIFAGGSLVVTDSTFEENDAIDGDGGAIRGGINSTIQITGSTFDSNRATSWGGAIFTPDGSTLDVTDTEFSENTANNGNGGAIATQQSVVVTNSHFDSNEAETGGAIFATADVQIGSSLLEMNSAVLGGAVAAGGQVTVEDTSFAGNEATAAGGGAIQANGTIDVTDSRFEANTAALGGALWTPLADVEVAGSEFIENSAVGGPGGAIRAAGSVTISDSNLAENSASVNGGAVAADDVEVFSSQIVSNRSREAGGIHADSTVRIEDGSLVADNEASTTDGGGVVAGADVRVTFSTLAGNSAARNGGAILSAGGLTILANATVTGNTADAGGGIWTDGSIELLYATVVGNEGADGANLHIGNPGGELDAFGSVVAATVGDNCALAAGVATDSHGYNFSDDATCGFTAATDTENGGDPGLGPLADNGGPTPTLLPAATSPLVDAIPLADCDGTLEIDQRGVSRPQGSGCDVGAVEVATDDGDDGGDGGGAPGGDGDDDGLPATGVSATGLLLAAFIMVGLGTATLLATGRRRAVGRGPTAW